MPGCRSGQDEEPEPYAADLGQTSTGDGLASSMRIELSIYRSHSPKTGTTSASRIRGAANRDSYRRGSAVGLRSRTAPVDIWSSALEPLGKGVDRVRLDAWCPVYPARCGTAVSRRCPPWLSVAMAGMGYASTPSTALMSWKPCIPHSSCS